MDPPPPETGVQALPAYALWDGIGVNTHLLRANTAYLDLPATVNAFQQLGVRHHRTDSPSSSATNMAALNQIYTDAGAKAEIVMGKPARTRPTLWPAALLSAYIANGLSSAAVGAFEGPNEQNLATHNELPANGYTEAQWATATLDHQTELFTTVNSSSRPDAWRAIPVVGWSFANPTTASGRLAECSTVADWDALCDISNMHKYVPTNLTSGFQPALGNVQTYIYNNLSHPMYVTETGYHTLMTYSGSHAPTPLDAAAWYTVKNPFVWMKNGISRVFFYELLDEYPPADPKLNQGHYGFFYYKAPAAAGNFSIKPNGAALANLLAIYADASGASFAAGKLDYTITVSAPNLDTALHQRSTDNAFLLALYRDVILFNRTGAVSPFGTYPTVADVNVTIDLGKVWATVEHRRPSWVTGAGGSGSTLISTATNVSAVTVPVGKHLSVLVIK